MTNYQSKMPGIVYAGDCLDSLQDIVRSYHPGMALIITDKGVRGANLVQPVIDRLVRVGTQYCLFDGAVPEPSWQDVEASVQQVSKMKPGLVIAVGGGSVMDTAKLISLLIDGALHVKDLLREPLKAKKAIPSIMIPTTCGTGSEATANAIVAVPEEQIKVGIVNPEMIPDAVILDPQMIRGLPAAIVAATGIDALAHAVECYTSNKANPISDTYALSSAKLIFGNLLRAYHEAGDMQAKEAMLLGAFFGGAAIASSGTTAVHALSYPLGGKFHIPHGVSNAILFGPVMRYNLDACQDRLARMCEQVWPGSVGTDHDKALKVLEQIELIVARTKIPPLSSFGVQPDDLEFLANAGFGVKRLLNNNLRQLTLEDVRAIYQAVLVPKEGGK